MRELSKLTEDKYTRTRTRRNENKNKMYCSRKGNRERQKARTLTHTHTHTTDEIDLRARHECLDDRRQSLQNRYEQNQ